MNRIIASSCVWIVLLVSPLSATAVTIGYLETDPSWDYITDTVSGRQYLRFDEFNLSYADTVTAVDAGGIYDGWKIATSEENDDFINAMFSTTKNDCTDQPNMYYEYCGGTEDWYKDVYIGIFGSSYSDTEDYYAYVSTQGSMDMGSMDMHGSTEERIGLTMMMSSGVVEVDDWGTIAMLDDISGINLLLYRDHASVPEPTTLSLMGLGLAALGFSRRRKVKKSMSV